MFLLDLSLLWKFKIKKLGKVILSREVSRCTPYRKKEVKTWTNEWLLLLYFPGFGACNSIFNLLISVYTTK